jgi:hypothetical protein
MTCGDDEASLNAEMQMRAGHGADTSRTEFNLRSALLQGLAALQSANLARPIGRWSGRDSMY